MTSRKRIERFINSQMGNKFRPSMFEKKSDLEIATLFMEKALSLANCIISQHQDAVDFKKVLTELANNFEV